MTTSSGTSGIATAYPKSDVIDAIRRLLLWMAGWYDERAAYRRQVRAEAKRRRAINARKRTERLIGSYRAADGRLRR